MRIKINSATGYFKEKNDEKYLTLDSTKGGGEQVFYKKNYCKIGVNTEDDLPLKESLKFLTLIVNIN